ncbi:unnamed protein product [Polarella glacialis]|uniref:RING-type domain-containing protein n=1 Tax=Polarella glacialis TaxID=89957 RepID=A0A813JZ00_POLGL|nr:unnamed protein product [Polarella glacialis]
MDFLQQLNQVSCEVSEQRHAEQELAADALIEEFQKKCLLAAQEGKVECRHVKDIFFIENEDQFPGKFECRHVKGTFVFENEDDLQQEFPTFLQQKLQTMFGQNSQASVSLDRDILGSIRGIELAASWPKPRPTGTAAQHSSSHVPRSNLNSQCPVCLCQAEVVALTPCGHVLCVSCSSNFDRGTSCPVCREPVAGRQNLFS